jgi:hypothetical protein
MDERLRFVARLLGGEKMADLGFFDLETTRLEPIANPFQAKVLPMCPE